MARKEKNEVVAKAHRGVRFQRGEKTKRRLSIGGRGRGRRKAGPFKRKKRLIT